jgi:hypothetical protein
MCCTPAARPTLLATCLSLGAAALLISVVSLRAHGDSSAICPDPLPPAPPVSLQDVYRDMPFQPGEWARYSLSYLGVSAGFSVMEVDPPANNRGSWYRAFRMQAQTGDWYKRIYDGHGSVFALSRPWDFGAIGYWHEQEGQALLTKRTHKRRVLTFEQNACKVVEYTKRSGKRAQTEEVALSYGATDVLSAAYYLRTKDYEIGKIERTLLYASGKNLWLEVNPVGYETLTVPAGTFKALRLKLRAYFRDEPLRKRSVELWLVPDHPNRPIVRAEAQTKAGHVSMELMEFVAGQSDGRPVSGADPERSSALASRSTQR